MSVQVDEIELQKRELILQSFHEGKTARETSDDILKTFGTVECYRHRTCQRWFDKFRTGNFDLINKNFDRKLETRKSKQKKKKQPPKSIQVQQVSFKHQKEPTNKKTRKEELQTILQKKSEITVSKVTAGTIVKKPPFQPNVITKRVVRPSAENSTSVAPKSASPATKQHGRLSNGVSRSLRPRPVPSEEVNLKLSPSLVKKMTPHSSTENHRIANRGIGNSSVGGENNAITVQFQNINSDIAKNTVRKTHTIEKRREKVTMNINSAVVQRSTALKTNLGKKSVSALNLRDDNALKRNMNSSHFNNIGRKTFSFGGKNDSIIKPSSEMALNKSYTSLMAKNTTLKANSLGKRSLPASFSGVENNEITAHFQNINSGLTKNTLRKSSDVGNTRTAHSQPNQATSLTSTKGIIYLNPQEIFRQSFGKFEKTPKRPDQIIKPPQKFPKTSTPLNQPNSVPQIKNDSVIIDDSDSEMSDNDLVFPQDVTMPTPRVKAICNTFTTYWDIEKEVKPILLNSPDDAVESATPIIEID